MGVAELDPETKLTFEASGDPDIVEVADGCADISVVTMGTLVAFGIRDAPLLKEVDENNLAKVRGGHTDEHGKFIKPKNHRPPRIMQVLLDQGYDPKATVEEPVHEEVATDIEPADGF